MLKRLMEMIRQSAERDRQRNVIRDDVGELERLVDRGDWELAEGWCRHVLASIREKQLRGD